MLTAALLASILMAPVQDAEPTTVGSDAPAETAAPVRDYLTDAESALYHPEENGLRSLSFAIALPGPMGSGTLGTIHVSWSAEEGDAISVDLQDGLPFPPQMIEPLRTQAAAMGKDILVQQLNRLFTHWLTNNVATLEGVEEGLVKVRLMPVPGNEGPVREQVLLFDDDGIVQKAQQKLEGMGQSATGTTTFTWRPVTADSDLLVLASQVSETDTGGPIKIRETLTYRYIEVGDLMLISGLQIQAMGQSQDLALDDLQVNGQLVQAAADEEPQEVGEG